MMNYACRKTFGHIPGIPVGTWWETRCVSRLFAFAKEIPHTRLREACSIDAIHA